MTRLGGGWSNAGGSFDNVGYYKDPTGRVWMRGTISGGTLGVSAFTLPAGYRPTGLIEFSVESNDAYGTLEITTAGLVKPTVGSTSRFSLYVSFLTT